MTREILRKPLRDRTPGKEDSVCEAGFSSSEVFCGNGKRLETIYA